MRLLEGLKGDSGRVGGMREADMSHVSARLPWASSAEAAPALQQSSESFSAAEAFDVERKETRSLGHRTFLARAKMPALSRVAAAGGT